MRRLPVAALIVGLLALAPGPSAPEPGVSPAGRPERRDLEGMRLGLVMLGPNAERAFRSAGLDADPRALTLAQIEEVYAVLSRAIALGPAERERLARITSP